MIAEPVVSVAVGAASRREGRSRGEPELRIKPKLPKDRGQIE